jgi:ParB family chromosome partitioning protein
MSKEDELRRTHGSAIGASFGPGYAPGIMPSGMSLADAQRLPARLQGVSKSKDAYQIPTDKIERDEDQPREEFDENSLDRLADSLKTRGQLQPIRVRWDEGRGTYVIIAGERRWRAAVRAGLPALSCVVHEGPIDPAEMLTVQLVENALREDLKPVEQAKAFKRLMETHGWSGNQLAKELAITQSSVSRTLALLELPEAVQAKVEAGELAARTAYELTKLSDPGAQAEVAEQVLADGLNGAQAADVIRARKAGRPVPASAAARREVKLDDGTKITVSGPGAADTEAVLAALRMASRRVQAELRDAARQADGQGEAA